MAQKKMFLSFLYMSILSYFYFIYQILRFFLFSDVTDLKNDLFKTEKT